jgi:hypothetical protein
MMVHVRVLLIFFALTTLNVLVLAKKNKDKDEGCEDAGGVCQNKKDDCDGNKVSKFCSGRQATCCIPYDESGCTDLGGTCLERNVDCNAGNGIEGLCDNKKRTCCVPYDDSACHAEGGECLAANEKCDGNDEKRLCDGNQRKCCVPYDDSLCNDRGGFCQDGDLQCGGGHYEYDDDLCGGPFERKCCVLDEFCGPNELLQCRTCGNLTADQTCADEVTPEEFVTCPEGVKYCVQLSHDVYLLDLELRKQRVCDMTGVCPLPRLKNCEQLDSFVFIKQCTTCSATEGTDYRCIPKPTSPPTVGTTEKTTEETPIETTEPYVPPVETTEEPSEESEVSTEQSSEESTEEPPVETTEEPPVETTEQSSEELLKKLLKKHP